MKACQLPLHSHDDFFLVSYPLSRLNNLNKRSMAATHYKVWSVGNPVGVGATASRFMGVASIAKCDLPGQPYIVANEFIVASLARAIRLPIPPSSLVTHESKSWHVSQNFNLAGENLPPANPNAIVTAFPKISWGIVLFDAWVANPDRHQSNLAFDQAGNTLQIFDHSHALFAQTGRAALETQSDKLGIGGHCLAPHLTSLNGMQEWADRIGAIPEFYIKETLADATELNIPQDVADWTVSYLLDRRGKLMDLVKAHKTVFCADVQALIA